MKITAKDILKPALILFVICLVVTALLAGTNLLTKDKIAEQSALEAEQSRKVVLSDADSFEEADGYYIGKANNETVGYVFQTEAKGYGGVRHHFRLPRGGYYPDDGRVLHFERIHIPPRHEAPPDGR